MRQAVVQGAAMNRVTRPEEAVAGGEAGDCCTRRAAAQAVPRAQAMHKRLSAPWVEVSLGAGEVLHLDGAGADSEADVLVML